MDSAAWSFLLSASRGVAGRAAYALPWLAVTTLALAVEQDWRLGLLLVTAVATEWLTSVRDGKAVTVAGLLAPLAVLSIGLEAGLALAATSTLIGDGVVRRRPTPLVLWNFALFSLMVTAGAVAAGKVSGLEAPAALETVVPAIWLTIFAAWLVDALKSGRKMPSVLPGLLAMTVIVGGFAAGSWEQVVHRDLASWLAATMTATRFAGAFMLVDFLAASVRARSAAGRVGTAFWVEHLPLLFFRYNGLIIAGALLAQWASVEGDAVLALSLVGLLVAQAAYRLYERAGSVSEAAIAALGEAIEARDPYTAGHSRRVADYASRFATFLGWSRGRVDRLRRAALLHDVGKIGVSDAVLFKPGRLDDDEFEQMKRHAIIGESIVSRIPGLERIARIAGEDHEHWAGGGYPRGLRGEDIMLEARLLAIVDVFDAMTTDRPYRAALTGEQALLHLESVAGVQLDPVMTQQFIDHVRDGLESGVLFCYCATH